MKNLLLLFASLLLLSHLSFGQASDTSQIKVAVVDTNKQELNSLPAAVPEVKKTISDAESTTNPRAKEQKINAIKDSILLRQAAAVKLCAVFVDRFAQGTKATETILTALNGGITFGELSSPFVSPTFKNSYDNWIAKWGRFLPAVLLPTASLFLNNENAKVGTVAIGVSLTSIISIFTNSDKKRNQAFAKAIDNVTSTLDLFDFNRTVFDDLQKLKTVINSVDSADINLYSDFKNYWLRNKDINEVMDKADIIKDKRFLTYIDSSTVLFERFQLKLARVNYVLDFAGGMIESYQERYKYISKIDTSSSHIKEEIQTAIKNLKKAFDDNKVSWNELQNTFYKLTPTETRKFETFYQLEEIKKSLESN